MSLGKMVISDRAQYRISRSAHRGFWYRFPYRLAEEVFINPIVACIKSPVSGLVIGWGDVFSGESWIDPTTGYYAQNFMLAVLLPKQATVPDTCEQAFMEFCDLCSRYRQSLFRNHHLVGQSGLKKVMEIWSEQEIDEVLTKLKGAPVVVRSVSSLGSVGSGPPYTGYIEQFKQRYPANFFSSSSGLA